MKITINYHSIWQNRFLDIKYKDDGKIQSKFTATSKQKERISAPITKNTVLGVLCRLVGDQRKLYDIRSSKDYIFKDIEDQVTFSINKRKQKTFSETAFIINKSDKRCAQSTFIGVLPDDTPLFFSETAPQLWSVLYLSLDEIMQFILSDKAREVDYISEEHLSISSPKRLLSRIDEITDKKSNHGKIIKSIERMREENQNNKDKIEKKYLDQKDKFSDIENPTKAKINTFNKQQKKHEESIQNINDQSEKLASLEAQQFDATLKNCINILNKKFHDQVYLENGVVFPIRLYAAALYLQVERMRVSGKKLDYCIKSNGDIGIQGFSKRGFNGTRDFLNKLAGGKTKTVGTPYPLTKSDGIIEIKLKVDKEFSEKIHKHIENAGVSSFYLGKKGLAYVSNIRV